MPQEPYAPATACPAVRAEAAHPQARAGVTAYPAAPSGPARPAADRPWYAHRAVRAEAAGHPVASAEAGRPAGRSGPHDPAARTETTHPGNARTEAAAHPVDPAGPAAPPATGARPRSRPTSEEVRQALRTGADAARAVLAEADDTVLLRVLDAGAPQDALTGRQVRRVIDELVSRAGRRRPETADAVCREVLRSLLYLDRPAASVSDGGGGGAGDPDAERPRPAAGRTDTAAERPADSARIRDAITLYEGLVRPYAERGRTPELLAAVLPRLWNLPGGAGREVVVRIVDGPGPAGFGESGWRALFLNVAAPGPWAPTAWDPGPWAPTAGDSGRWAPSPGDRGPWRQGREPAGPPDRAASGLPRRFRTARHGRPRSTAGEGPGLRPGQLWVTGLLVVIAVALALIVVLALA